MLGGESSGAGMEVPSVSEKLMGASVNGLNLVGGIAAVIGEFEFPLYSAEELRID